MDISSSGLTARTYRAARVLLAQVRHGENWHHEYQEKSQTDLCSLVWAVLVGAPLALAANAAVVAGALFACGNLIYALVTNLTIVAVLVAVVLVLLLAVSVILGIGWTWARVEQSEVGHVAAEYYRARKARLCPIVAIREDAP